MIRCTRRRLLVGKPVVDGDHRRIETRQAFRLHQDRLACVTQVAWVGGDRQGFTNPRDQSHDQPGNRLAGSPAARFSEVVRAHWGIENSWSDERLGSGYLI
jgi:hypothetical protein